MSIPVGSLQDRSVIDLDRLGNPTTVAPPYVVFAGVRPLPARVMTLR